MAERRTARESNFFHFDKGSLYTKKQVKYFFFKDGKIQKFTCAYTPQQNGTVKKKKNRTILEAARDMLKQ